MSKTTRLKSQVINTILCQVFISNLIVAIKGMPADTPFMFDVYHSPVQQAARSHPNSLAVQRAINALWHDKSENQTTIQEPLSYADGFRIRPEDTIFNALPPHIGMLFSSLYQSDYVSRLIICRWRQSLALGR